MSAYRNTLDKINLDRDKTDAGINRIKVLMAKAETDTQAVERLLRGKGSQLRQLVEAKEKELIQQLHLQKQKVLNQLVLDKLELEDFKLREYFPLKLFEILEEKLYTTKELPTMSLLAQTRYFKKLLDQTYSLRKQTCRALGTDETTCQLTLTAELVEQRMHDITQAIERSVLSLVESTQLLESQEVCLPRERESAQKLRESV